MAERWARAFDYIDGLDAEMPNPSETRGSAERWAAMRRRNEAERMQRAADFRDRIRIRG